MMSAADQSSLPSQRGYWISQIGGWGLFFLLQWWLSWKLMAAPLIVATFSSAVQMFLFVVATHLLRRHSKLYLWIQLSTRALLRRIFFSSVLLSISILAIAFSVIAMLHQLGVPLGQMPRTPFGLSLSLGFINSEILLLVWMAIYFGVVILRQRQYAGGEEARLRAALRTAELSLLKSQLNPHFLFNALNTVRALIAESPERAQLAVTQLARTLRYSLNSARDELVTLENELEIVGDYLGIETLRLAERLTIVHRIAPETLQTRIPIMLLQTLVENAVKHGISQRPQGGTLIIAARMQQAALLIEVSNDRPLIKSGSIPSDRVGLANANERLRLMIGPAASLKLDLSHSERAIATVLIPQPETAR